ncbi:MAG: phosphate-starvation-inducible E [Gallionellaceae bacterium]|nr:MAG: phosphate-starvation-inducible E [Gallionellaceae bacterium]
MMNQIKHVNMRLLSFVENIGLLVIAIATVSAMLNEVLSMLSARNVSLADLLMMFLYMEVLAMVGLHYSTGKMPVRFPLYIGMVALARYLVLDMKEMDVWRMLAVSCSILLLTLAVFMVRFGHVRYPYDENQKKS